MKDCLFCKKYDEKSKEIFYEDKYFYAQFDIFPINPGHAEIIPIRHIVSLSDLTRKEWKHLKPAISNVERVIEETDLMKVYESFLGDPVNERSEKFCNEMLRCIGLDKKPDAYNIGINDGRAAGRTIDHLHIHIIPRYFGDVENPRGGVRHIIPGKGNY